MEYVIHLQRGTHTQEGYGCKVSYYRITEQVGVKVYGHESDRDRCHERQGIARQHKLGPPTHGVCDVVMHLDSGKVQWIRPGYLTGHAGESCCDTDRDEVERKLEDIFDDVRDMHSSNARMYEGVPVCIDFGFDGGTYDRCRPEEDW